MHGSVVDQRAHFRKGEDRNARRRDVALWTPWIFQDGFESGDTSRWSSAVR